jgi:hypothetical protein
MAMRKECVRKGKWHVFLIRAYVTVLVPVAIITYVLALQQGHSKVFLRKEGWTGDWIVALLMTVGMLSVPLFLWILQIRFVRWDYSLFGSCRLPAWPYEECVGRLSARELPTWSLQYVVGGARWPARPNPSWWLFESGVGIRLWGFPDMFLWNDEITRIEVGSNGCAIVYHSSPSLRNPLIAPAGVFAAPSCQGARKTGDGGALENRPC